MNRIHTLSLVVATMACAALQSFAQPSPTATLRWSAAEIEHLASRMYFEGVPVDVVQSFPPAIAVPVLKRLLANPEKSASWPNAAGMLGLVGSASDAATLIALIEAPTPAGADALAVQRARSSALIGLGYLVNRNGSPDALRYLQEGLSPGAWSRRAAQIDGFGSADEREQQLGTLSALALGVSGKPQALEALSQAERQGRSQLPLQEAMDTNRAIASGGLLGYYKLQARPNLQLLRPGQVLPRGPAASESGGLGVPLVFAGRQGRALPSRGAQGVLTAPRGPGESLPPGGSGEMLREPQEGEFQPGAPPPASAPR